MKAKVKANAGRKPSLPPLPGCVDPALNRTQVAATIGTSLRNLTAMLSGKMFPPPDYRHNNGSPRWLYSTVREWQLRKRDELHGVGEKANIG